MPLRINQTRVAAIHTNAPASSSSAHIESVGTPPACPTAAVLEPLLFAGFGSAVADDAAAVFVSDPLALAPTVSVNWNVADAPAESVAIVQLIDAGTVTQLNGGPVICVAETHVVFGGAG